MSSYVKDFTKTNLSENSSASAPGLSLSVLLLDVHGGSLPWPDLVCS